MKDRGYLTFVVIRPENDASKSLYTKLGFSKKFETVRAILRPYGSHHEQLDGGTIVEEPIELNPETMNGGDTIMKSTIENGENGEKVENVENIGKQNGEKHNGNVSTVTVHENGDYTNKDN